MHVPRSTSGPPNNRPPLPVALPAGQTSIADLLDRTQPAHHRIRALYVHVPFCFHKCCYCDFYSIVDTHDRHESFVDRLIRELDVSTAFLHEPMETVFIGGGTPTLLAPGLWQRLLDAIHRCLPLAPEIEFTVEANPETVTEELAAVLARGRVNRVSIGAQSFNLRLLEALERRHKPRNVARSVRILRAAGIHNISLDLIFAIPGQSLDDWLADLDAALALQPDHLSCYGLTCEPNTPLAARVRSGRIHPADENLEAAMYEATLDRLADAGFVHYEISNWARPGRRCQHNLTYWRNGDFWPLGPSASGHVSGLRWKNLPNLADYLAHEPLPPVTDVERLDHAGRAGEQLMLGLRLVEGLPDRVLEHILSAPGGDHRRAAIDAHLADGLLSRTDGRLRLTRRGLLLADTVLADLI